MRILLALHTLDMPAGGMIAACEMANGLARRGHQVTLAHFVNYPAGVHIKSASEITWMQFDPAVEHVFMPGLDYDAAPDADVIIEPGAEAPDRCGLPVTLLQGLAVGIERVRVRLRRPGPALCVSRWLTDLARAEGVPPERLVHIPNGVDHGVFRVTTPPADRSAVVAMHYGTHPLKNGQFGLDVIDRVCTLRPETAGVLFGKVAPPDGLPTRTTFTRLPPRELLVDHIYNGAQVFIQPSRSEGFGLVGLEALACGAALVTSDCGGPLDYAVDGVTAEVVPIDAFDETVDRVVALLDDHERRIALASAGSAASTAFTWDRTAEIIEATLVDYVRAPERYGVTR